MNIPYIIVRCKDESNLIGDRVYIRDNIINIDNKEIEYDKVYINKTNDEIYQDSIIKSYNYFLEGFNACIMAYGRTGSGKTYIMDSITNNIISSLSPSLNIGISIFELYNERFIDLCSSGEIKNCKFHEISIIIPNNNIYKIIESAYNKRKISCTVFNSESSRSHLITILYNMERKNKILLLDLAGSEKYVPLTENLISKTPKKSISSSNTPRKSIDSPCTPSSIDYKFDPKKLQIKLLPILNENKIIETPKQAEKRRLECKNINSSLLALSNMIRELSKENKIINYRDSQLTLLLHDVIGSNSCLTIICTISQYDENIQTTIDTLIFGSQAKLIKQSAKPLEIINNNKDEKIKTLTLKLNSIEEELKKTKENEHRLLSMLERNTSIEEFLGFTILAEKISFIEISDIDFINDDL